MRDRLTYRYPRTIVEAFGCDAQSAYPIHGPYRRQSSMQGLLGVVAFVVGAFVLGAFFS
jgi:hypothetical protein